MLKLVWLSQQACQKNLWEQFDPSKELWIVSDRKSKFFLTRSLLERFPLINEPVKRAKEYWRDILFQVDPGIRALDDLGARVQARDFLLSEGASEWCKRPNAPQRLLDGCLSLAPLVTNELVDDVLTEFEAEYGRTSGPFLELARLGALFYRRCLEKKRVPKFFLPFFLAQQDTLPVSEQKIIFDLGFEIREGEKELIQRLSRENDVTVMIPGEDALAIESVGVHPYLSIDVGLAQVKNEYVPNYQLAPPQVQLWRCSSPEAEARKAVEMIAKLVAQGVKPEQICVAAERFSNYEHILAHDLMWEGIGLQRTINTRLSASRLFRALDARLLIVRGTLRSSIIEEAFLTVAPYKQKMRRRKERGVLKPVVHESQVPPPEIRARINELRKMRPAKKGIVDFEELLIDLFSELAQVASQYEDVIEAQERNEYFLKALQKLRAEVGDVELDFPLWVEAWQEVTNSILLTYHQAAEHGVWGSELASTEESPADYLIVLGAVESGQRNSVVSGLGEARLGFLANKGFDLTTPLKRKNDPLLMWLITGNRKEIVLSCPRTDSTGKAVAASPLWLKLAAGQGKDLDELDYARRTRWIEVQKTILRPPTAGQVDRFKGWTQKNAEKIGQLVLEELSGTRQVKLPEMPAKPLPIPMSASRIESYWECPFKFYARALLGLFDEADLEVEPSPQKRGQWLHAAVEEILKSGRELGSWTEAELALLVDGLDEVQKQVASDIWPSIRSRFVRQLMRFIDFEISWRKLYPRANPAGFEAGIQGVIGWPEKKPEIHFAPDKPVTGDDFWASFRGSIDRVDKTTAGKAIILDYKTSNAAASNISSWPKKGVFQLALYTEAVEAGLLQESGPAEVIAAQYYSLKKLEREKGFKLIDQDLSGILPASGNAKSAVTTGDRQKVFSEINEGVHGILEKIRQGEMTPLPHNESLCPACSWRTSCRAPHLS